MTLLKFLDVSPAHLCLGDVSLIEANTLPIDTMTCRHGRIVSTATLIDLDKREDKIAMLRKAGVSISFLTAIIAAADQGAWLLRFDADADIDDSLPIGGYCSHASPPSTAIVAPSEQDVNAAAAIQAEMTT